jgi:signal transduction histidine kinase
LIQSVLHYSRLAQPHELLESVDLNEIMRSVISDYELLISDKNALVEYTALPVVPGNSAQLGQLFSNLLGNSLKFSNERPKIAISWRQIAEAEKAKLPTAEMAKQYVEIRFSDNGIGFEQQYVERIFAIFQRLNSRDQFGGTGIGLALCKKIVENHNGFITALSELGKGATFFIYLPYT